MHIPTHLTTVRPAIRLFSASLLLLGAQALLAQAPAGAPAGSNGICKDGTYSTAASKSGACRGHKGVQTWYKADIATMPAPTPGKAGSLPAAAATNANPAMPAPTRTTMPSANAPASTSSMPSRPSPTAANTPSAPAPSRAASAPSMPAPQSGQATGVKPGISAERAKLASMPAAAGGGPGLVWVNASSKVYHCPGSEFYGKTKTGSYMTESAAQAAGSHADHNKPCS